MAIAQKIADLAALAAADANDVLAIVDDPAGGAATKKIVASAINKNFTITAAEIAAGVTPTDLRFPEGNVLRYGPNTIPGTTDMTIPTQNAIDVMEAALGGDVQLDYLMLWTGGVTIDSDCVTLRGHGGTRNISDAVGTRINYSGSGKAIFDNSANGVSLLDFRLEATGIGTIGIHHFNCQGCYSRNVHVREFSADNWLLECDTIQSTLYNTFINCSGFRITTKVANGLRMVEGVGKAVNNNIFFNCDFSNNLVGVQQDSETNDNVFVSIELGACITGMLLRGRTHIVGTIENCTTALNLVSGSAAVVSGFINFGGNATDISNSGNRPIPAILHGGGASSGGWNATGSGYGFRGLTPPSTGGVNYSITDGDPTFQRNNTTYMAYRAADIRFNQDLLVAANKGLLLTNSWIHLPITTTAELESITNDVNTNTQKRDGTLVKNTTTGAIVSAAGSADGDVWEAAAGGTAHTPI